MEVGFGIGLEIGGDGCCCYRCGYYYFFSSSFFFAAGCADGFTSYPSGFPTGILASVLLEGALLIAGPEGFF
jgi:hypothetical protein